MPVWTFASCGNNHPEWDSPPQQCIIGADERRWVPSSGQRRSTLAELATAGHRSEVREVEPGLLGIGVTPTVAIGQRAVVVQTSDGNLLWAPPGFPDEPVSARPA